MQSGVPGLHARCPVVVATRTALKAVAHTAPLSSLPAARSPVQVRDALGTLVLVPTKPAHCNTLPPQPCPLKQYSLYDNCSNTQNCCFSLPCWGKAEWAGTGLSFCHVCLQDQCQVCVPRGSNARVCPGPSLLCPPQHP